MYTDVVNYNIAKLLDNKLYGDDKYAAEDLEVTWDNYLTVTEYKEGELIEDGDNVHGKYYLAPIYADVIDWLFNEKNVVIKFDPVFTFSTKNHMAYYIEAYKKNEDESKLDLIFEDKLMMYSFELAIETILKKSVVMSEKKFVKEVIELVYCSCKNHMWDYMDMHDYDAIDAIYKDIKDDLSIELD